MKKDLNKDIDHLMLTSGIETPVISSASHTTIPTPVVKLHSNGQKKDFGATIINLEEK